MPEHSFKAYRDSIKPPEADPARPTVFEMFAYHFNRENIPADRRATVDAFMKANYIDV